MAFLNKQGLEQLWQHITLALSSKVSKVNGKDLSTNDYTTAEKNKLAGIAAGAQVNSITGVKGNSESTYRTGNVNITKANIGLGNVDNTADANKNVLSATKLTTARMIGKASFNGTADIAAADILGSGKTPSTSDTTQRYAKILSVTFNNNAYSTCAGLLLISRYQGNAPCGLVDFSFIQHADNTWESGHIKWLSLDDNKYAGCFKAVYGVSGANVLDLYYDRMLISGGGLSFIGFTLLSSTHAQRITLYSSPSYVTSLTNVKVTSTYEFAATKLTTNAGSATQPIYFSGGKPVATTYTLEKSVPSDAKFTDTTYSVATTSANGLMTSAMVTKLNGIATGANAYTLPVAGTAIGGVKSGTDITVDSSGNVSVNDNSHNHTIANITDLQTSLNAKAPLASPALTGTPTAPTATAGTNSTQVATTAFVKNAVDTAVTSKMTFKGSTATLPTSTTNGDMYKASAAIAKTSKMDAAAKVGDTLIYSTSDNLWHIIPSGDDIEDTWRTIQVNGTQLLGGGTSTGVLNLKAGSNVSLTGSGNDITIAATNTTYNAASTSANGLMTSAMVTKLNGIATGAEVNQNAFGNITVGSTTISADAKTDTLELVAGSNITLTPDATNDKITITATNTTYSAATTSAAGLMSAADKTKLDTNVLTDSSVSFYWGSLADYRVLNFEHNGTRIAYATLPGASTSSAGLMTATDKTNLDNALVYNKNVFAQIDEPSSPTTGTIWLDIS